MNAVKKITRKPIDEKDFVKAWVRVQKAGGSLKDVAEELGCSYAGAKNKADKLAESGIQLPALKKGRGPKIVDVAALKNLVKDEMARKA